RNWLTMAWPKEWGGLGAGQIRQALYNEIMGYYGAPGFDMGVDRVGPTLMLYGSEEQRANFLPKITNVEIEWCQGFSEPNAGSDLGSLQTRAILDGDHFTVNGQKIWTSFAHRADWMLLLARTAPDAPKHRGISMLLVDMQSPGITVQPLRNLSGTHGFNEVFFDNVQIPRDRLVGEFNRGWYQAMSTLDFERSGINRIAGARRVLDDIAHLAKAGQLVMPESRRTALAELAIEYQIGRLLALRVAWLQSVGRIPNYEAAMSKLYGSEMQQRVANFSMNLFGAHSQQVDGVAGSATAPASYYLNSLSFTIAAGTSEINRNIIATRGLGLPRG
ncbi:MAG: acyl-CoA dehydrogenase family protein, partial [Tepidiformaceae bacterium]